MNAADLYPELLRPYDPRVTPLPPPTQGVCDGPVYTICINEFWWSHVSGVIARLLYRDAWDGTDDEIDAAINSISKILNVGRPTMGCGCGESGLPSRINSDGVYQVSYDNGVTWVDAPQFDPRNNVTLLPITVTGTTDEKKCKAANSAVAYFKQMEADTHARKQAGATLAAIAEAAIAFLVVVGIIASGGALAVLGGALAAIAANASADDFNAAFTDAVWADLLCAIYCAFDSDLSISDAKWTEIVSHTKTDHPGIAGDYLSNAINMMGSKALTNATRLGLAGALDCSGCDCPAPCDIDQYVFGYWIDGTFTDATATQEISRDANSITCRSFTRGDGQEIFTICAIDGMTFCKFTAEFIGAAPDSVLHSYNNEPNHANLNTLVPDDTGPVCRPVSQIYFQCDNNSSHWIAKFTMVDVCP